MNPTSRAFGWILLGILTSTDHAAAQLKLTQTSPIKAKATLELSSSSIQRGKTLIDGPSLHPSFWALTSFGLGIGAWGAAPLDNRDGRNPVFYEQKQGAFVKVDTYLAYRFLENEFVTMESILAQYYFPQENRLDNSRLRDFITKVTLPLLFRPFISVAYGLNANIRRDYYVEAGIQETLLRNEPHSLSINALSTYRRPDQPTPTKQEGIGHSLAAVAYNYGGVSLAGTYVFEGRKEVLEVQDATQFSTSLGYTAWF